MCKFITKIFKKKYKEIISPPPKINNLSDWSDSERAIALSIIEESSVVLIPDKTIREHCKVRVEYNIKAGGLTHDYAYATFKDLIELGYVNPSEILAKGYANPESTFNSWKRSEGHYKSITDASNRYFGVFEDSGVYCVIFTK